MRRYNCFCNSNAFKIRHDPIVFTVKRGCLLLEMMMDGFDDEWLPTASVTAYFSVLFKASDNDFM